MLLNVAASVEGMTSNSDAHGGIVRKRSAAIHQRWQLSRCSRWQLSAVETLELVLQEQQALRMRSVQQLDTRPTGRAPHSRLPVRSSRPADLSPGAACARQSPQH